MTWGGDCTLTVCPSTSGRFDVRTTGGVQAGCYHQKGRVVRTEMTAVLCYVDSS